MTNNFNVDKKGFGHLTNVNFDGERCKCYNCLLDLANEHFNWCKDQIGYTNEHRCFTCYGYNKIANKPKGHCNG